jgi:hypothetical protein
MRLVEMYSPMDLLEYSIPREVAYRIARSSKSELDMSIVPQMGHSAKIEAYLLVADQRLWLERIGGGSLTVRESYSVPPATPATVEVSIDGEVQEMPIVLVDGLSPGIEARYCTLG